jgi:hypothetical protein
MDHIRSAKIVLEAVAKRYDPEKDVSTPAVTWADEQLRFSVEQLMLQLEKLTTLANTCPKFREEMDKLEYDAVPEECLGCSTGLPDERCPRYGCRRSG